MGVRSKCLVAPAALPAGATTIYTCPAGETALIKSMAFYNSNAALRNVSVLIDAGSGATKVSQIPVAAASGLLVDLWWVLEPGWVLQWFAATGVNGAVFGSELEGVAD